MMEVNTWAEGIENWLGLLKLAGTTTLACRIITNCTTVESVLELGSMSQCLNASNPIKQETIMSKLYILCTDRANTD